MMPFPFAGAYAAGHRRDVARCSPPASRWSAPRICRRTTWQMVCPLPSCLRRLPFRLRQKMKTRSTLEIAPTTATRRASIQLSCWGEVGWSTATHANEAKASSVESNPFGFICGGFATFEW